MRSMNRFQAWTWFLRLRLWMVPEQGCGNWRRPMRSRLEVRRLISTAQWIKMELDNRSKSKASLRNKRRWRPQVSVDMHLQTGAQRAQKQQGMPDCIKPRLLQRTAPRRCLPSFKIERDSAREVLCYKIQQWRWFLRWFNHRNSIW